MPPKTVKRGSSTPGAKRGCRGSRGTPRGKINQPDVSEEPKRADGLAVEGEEGGVKVERALVHETPLETNSKVVEESKPVETSSRDVEESEQAMEGEKPVDTGPKVVEEEKSVETGAVKVEEETTAEQPEIGVEEESKIEREIKEEPLSVNMMEPAADKSSSKIVEEAKESNHEDEKDERLDLEDNDHEYEAEEYCGMDYDEKESEIEEYQEQVDEQSGAIEEDNAGEGEIDDMGEEEIEEVTEGYEEEEHDGHAGGQEHIERPDNDEQDHQEALKERRKRKEFEVFVGGLDKDATEEDLKKVFGKVGEVIEIRLMINPQTKKNKGFAFLRYASA